MAYNCLMENLVLTGFMGTGKTSVGQILAQRLGLTFVDTDALIEARDGRTVAGIFAQDGEAAFRQWETAVARELAAQTGLVIATGGRLMLNPENAAALEANGHVFCLTATATEILRRLAGDRSRPLLQVPDPAAQIRQLLHQRQAGYGRYPQIATDGKPPTAIAEEIMACLSTR